MAVENNSKQSEWDNHEANDNTERNTERPVASERKFEQNSYDESRDRPSYDRKPRYPREERFGDDRRSRFGEERRPSYPREDRFNEERRPSYPREDRNVDDRRSRFGEDRNVDDRRSRFGEERRPSYPREERYGDDRRPYYPRDDRYGDDRSYKRRDPYDDQQSSRYRSYDRFDSRRDGFEKRSRQMREDPTEPNVTIGIFNLSYNLTQRDFDEFLASKLTDFQDKYSTKLVISNETGRCRGYGFVTFESLEDSIKAKPILEDGEILGQKYRVAFSIQRRNYDRRPAESTNAEKAEVAEGEDN